MSISLVGSTVAGGFQAAVTVPVPAGVQPGDRLVIFASANDQTTIVNQPSEWAVLLQQQIDEGASTFVWVYTRSVAEEDPAQYTVVWEGDHWHYLHVVAFRGVERIRTQAHLTGPGVSVLPVPVVEARRGDQVLLGGFHWSATPKAWNPVGGLLPVGNMDRGWITAHQPMVVEGPTPTTEVVTSVAGLMCTVAVLLAPQVVPAPAIRFPLQIRTEIELPDRGWVDISADVRDTEDVQITRGRADEADVADASQCRLLLDNRHGKYSPRNPLSPYFGQLGRNTPLRVSLVVNGHTLPRFAGEVAEWPLQWDLSDHDVTVPLVANGPLRRLTRGSRPPRSALRRYINAHHPVAYWPLTDGKEAVVGAPDQGRHPVSVLFNSPTGSLRLFRSRMDWQGGTLAPWLEPVARTPSGSGESTGGRQGYLSGRVDQSSTAWSVDVVRAGAGGRDRLVALCRADGDGTQHEWRVRMDLALQEVRVSVRANPEDAPPPDFTLLGSFVDGRFFTDQARHVRLSVAPAGASQAGWQLWVDGDLYIFGTTGVVGSPHPVAQAQYWWDHRESVAADAEPTSVGHLAVWDESGTAAAPTPPEVMRALYGHRGERAGVRIERLAREEGIPLAAVGDLEDTPPLGPQETESPLEVMRDAEQVDDGVLHESREQVSLLYRTHRSMYTQRIRTNGGGG